MVTVYHNVQEYLTALEEYNKTRFRVVNGVGYAFKNGEWVQSEPIPRPTYKPRMKENPDGTKVGGSTFVQKKWK